MHVVALSGGKDSTALALRLQELEPDLDPVYLCTPTGDELPECVEHWEKLERILGKPIIYVRSHLDLRGWIEHFDALPNWRQRWCTRLLKIRVCLDWIQSQPERVTLCVGLRADEEKRKGIYSEEVDERFPMREWGWGIDDVLGYLRHRGVRVPRRTDCARCFYQTLGDWHHLWSLYPEVFEDAAQMERDIGHTFRSPTRDTWPAPLDGLGAEFAKGRIPRGGYTGQGDLDMDFEVRCRVCSL
jgi:3'-phosphoadenosine 5'-phosphosulfate sulfotransferase (PAPS reductase)/FAD synthetase